MGDVHIIMVVESELIIIEYLISGSLGPGYGHLYGKFCSCVQTEVKLAWALSDQVLGIGIVDADTGEGIVRWYTGSSAMACSVLIGRSVITSSYGLRMQY